VVRFEHVSTKLLAETCGNIQQVKNRKGPPKMGLHFMNAKGLKQQETFNNGNFPEMDVQPF
jgi:hypothetical protein